ncbi:hypothetical protein [Microbacterium galbinum]|uniref:hypothetical protein n=1 Tax=Microbacterium galbinum TaxID=2851646 RepID=UPI001FFDD79B|nr:hypothetical protein [Microbacterium galbinum]
MKFTKISALAGAATLVSLLLTGVAAAPATAAPIDATCGYAEEGTGGKFTDSICWFDFAGYDQSIGLTAEGQRFETTLGEYDIAYTVTQRPTGMGWQPRGVEARPSTDPFFPMGNWDYYDGIPGLPYLYANRGASFGSVQINIVDFEVTLKGVPVTGYDLVTAAPETPRRHRRLAGRADLLGLGSAAHDDRQHDADHLGRGMHDPARRRRNARRGVQPGERRNHERLRHHPGRSVGHLDLRHALPELGR